jgi:hypothetical protein
MLVNAVIFRIGWQLGWDENRWMDPSVGAVLRFAYLLLILTY